MLRKVKRATEAAQVLPSARQKRKSQQSFQGFLLLSLWRIMSVKGKPGSAPKESRESKESTKLSSSRRTNLKCFRKVRTSRNLSSSQKTFNCAKAVEAAEYVLRKQNGLPINEAHAIASAFNIGSGQMLRQYL